MIFFTIPDCEGATCFEVLERRMFCDCVFCINFVCYMMHIWFCVLCVDLCYVASMSLVGVGHCWASITNPLGITRASCSNHFKVSPWMMPCLKIGLPIFTWVKIGCENLIFLKNKTKMENWVRSNLLPRSRS